MLGNSDSSILLVVVGVVGSSPVSLDAAFVAPVIVGTKEITQPYECRFGVSVLSYEACPRSKGPPCRV